MIARYKKWALEDQVKHLLQEYKHLRDNDEALVCNIWVAELRHKYRIDYRELSAVDFMQYIVKKQVTNSATIRRVRRKLQEHDQTLRGDRYEIRKTKATQNMLNKLGYETTGK